MAEHDRRNFFKALIREAAQTAQEIQAALQPALEPEPEQPVGYTLPAQPSLRRVSVEELRTICDEVGLGGRADEIVGSARVSLRMTHGDQPAESQLGGLPWLPEGADWPAWLGQDLHFLAQVSLAEVATLEPESPLPPRGVLLCFFAVLAAPEDDGCRIVLVEDPDTAELDFRGPLALTPSPGLLTPELTLPRRLEGLAPEDLDAWQFLRSRLADAQGVELEEESPRVHALHRVLGHPDDGPAPPGPEWRLLLQISSDDELGLTLGDPPGRLVVWIRDEDLAALRFDEIRAQLFW